MHYSDLQVSISFGIYFIDLVSPQQIYAPTNHAKSITVEEILQFMFSAFLRGGVSGFLKSGKSSSGVTAGGHKETRIGIALVFNFALY